MTGEAMESGNFPQLLQQRRTRTDQRVTELRQWLMAAGTEALTGNTACVYATGSVGRGEASEHSDLDVFVVSTGELKRLDGIRLQAKLIDATGAGSFPPFSGDGEYLQIHKVGELIRLLGTRDDDHTNVFTARLLLLLESRPILGTTVYESALRQVIDSYWGDFDDHKPDFLPIFLANDISRYWKVLCVSYEAAGPPTSDVEKAKRRLNNYKLKHSRLLTCYSALLYLASVLRQAKSVSRDDAFTMATLTPLDRLRAIREANPDRSQGVDELLAAYAAFLETTEASKGELLSRFAEDAYHDTKREEAHRFGDLIFALLSHLASESRLFRYLVV
jgi:predicted nucleotidyltransferase